MGQDETAVVARPTCACTALDGLSVADASLMPLMKHGGHPNAPVIMIAEKGRGPDRGTRLEEHQAVDALAIDWRRAGRWPVAGLPHSHPARAVPDAEGSRGRNPMTV